MKIEVLMNDGKKLFVNNIYKNLNTFTVSSKPNPDLNQDDLKLLQSFEPTMEFFHE